MNTIDPKRSSRLKFTRRRVGMTGQLAGVLLAALAGIAFAQDDQPVVMGSTLQLSGHVYEASLELQAGAETAADTIQSMVETANARLSEKLREDLRFSTTSLRSLAAYLVDLFPELDRGAPPSLTAVSLDVSQSDVLFNLYFELVDVQLPMEEDRFTYLESVGFDYAGYLARNISEQAMLLGECLSARAIADSNRVEVREDPEACAGGPRGTTLWINRLAISDPQALEAVNIDLEATEGMLELQRQLYMGHPERGIGGFPVEDLLGLVQSVADMYAATGGSGDIPPEVMRPVMQQLDDLRLTGGISFDQLKAISLELQNYLRRQDYFLARGFIPRQDFRQGTGEVLLGVTFGKLGDVAVRNGEELHYSDRVLLNPFQEYIGENVSRDIYQAYFEVNDLPGVRIRSGLFEPGDNPGETRLVLDVEEDRYRVVLAADNFGSEFTGEERAILALDWFSPFGLGDQLNLGVLQSIDPADSTYGYFNYTLPVWGVSHELALSWDRHEYDSLDGRSGTQVLIHGEVDSYYAGYNYKWLRSKGVNVEFGLRAFQRQSDTSVELPGGGNTQISEQNTDVTGALVSTEGDILVSRLRLIAGWQATLLYGEQDDLSNPRIDEEYVRFAVDTQGVMLLPWGPGSDSSSLSARFFGAYTQDVLPSFEQTPLGGPFGVRAYKSFDFTADSMAFLSTEWRVDVGQHFLGSLSDQNSLRLGIFAEVGYGEANAIGSVDDSWTSLSAYGLLVSYGWRDQLTVETSLALPGHDSTSDDFSGEISDDDYTILFDVRYLFD